MLLMTIVMLLMFSTSVSAYTAGTYVGQGTLTVSGSFTAGYPTAGGPGELYVQVLRVVDGTEQLVADQSQFANRDYSPKSFTINFHNLSYGTYIVKYFGGPALSVSFTSIGF